MTTYWGTCFCGAVEITVEGAPVAMGYCHCPSCRHWSAGPITAFTLWKPEAFRVVEGQQHLDSFSKTPNSERTWCRLCGGHVFTRHPAMGLVDVYAPILVDFPFRPMLHVHHAHAVLPVRDALLKLRDLPAEMGGSGEVSPDYPAR